MAGPPFANREPENKIKNPEKVTEQTEIHSNQSAADKPGSEESLGEADEDDDSDSSGSIIYTPEGSDEEDEGQEDRGNAQHGPFEENPSTQDTNPGNRQ